MTEFDISHTMFDYDDLPNCKGTSLTDVLEWVYANIGPETERNSLSSDIHRKGIGWEIQSRTRNSEKLSKLFPKRKPFSIISWHICIDDDYLATMFALRWGLK